jgi:hypothetical protein
MFLLQIYSCELEKAESFNDFADFCHSFQFGRGKDEDDEESNIVGELTLNIKLSKGEGLDPINQFNLQHFCACPKP